MKLQNTLECICGETILDIGSESGWTTALLSFMVEPKGRVTAAEIAPVLCRFGEQNVKEYRFIEKGAATFLCGNEITQPKPFAPHSI